MNLIQPTLRSIPDLRGAGLLATGDGTRLEAVATRYAVAVTPAMAALMATEGADGPVMRQFLPDIRELDALPQELPDPIGDAAHSPVEGIVHRYADRALLKIVHSCPVYCRFCFRREMVGPARPALGGAKLDAALAWLAATPAIWEVVVTGGDPFILSARRARELTRRIAAIPHVKVMRWHTRVPMVAPERVTPAFARALQAGGLSTWVAIHANHPREFTPDSMAAIGRLGDAGVNLVSQSVLLKGINDDVGTLAALMRLFVENGVKPYYLHHPDLAPGTGHFRVTLEAGQALMAGLRQRLSGLAMPAYVLDIPGGHGKVPAGPAYVVPAHVVPNDVVPAHAVDGSLAGTHVVTDRNGIRHGYDDA